MTAALAALAALTGTRAAPVPAPAPAQAGRPDAFDLQAHRGGLGLRPESTLAAFGHALRLGVSTLGLDVQITADGHVAAAAGAGIARCAARTPARRAVTLAGYLVLAFWLSPYAWETAAHLIG